MYHIAEAMARWLGPILSFTAEEIWRHLPGQREESVFLSEWYGGLFGLDEGNPFDRPFWEQLLKIREAVGKELEILRVRGEIGSSLDAEVELFCDDALFERLSGAGDELRFVLLTSYATVRPAAEAGAGALPTEIPGLELKLAASDKPKCVRCWHHRHDVGADPDHPGLCGRCVENVAGAGETRTFG
jgi:isoleucyl-tRNA synthetase